MNKLTIKPSLDLRVLLGIGCLAFAFAARAGEPKAVAAAPVAASSVTAETAVPVPSAKATVLIFFAHDCPMSNAYVPEIGRLNAEFTPRGAAFRIVYAERDLTAAKAKAHAKEFALPCPTIRDTGLKLAARVGATMTPQAAILSPRGELLYLGRIDDIYADYGKRRAQPQHRDLRDALAAVFAGRPVAEPRTPSLGCDIDFGPKSRGRK